MTEQRVPILMYHSVSFECAPRFAPFAVTPIEFDAQMRHLRECGYSALTVTELVAAYADAAMLPARPVVLSFDDGFRDFLTEALPTLSRYSLTATLYVVSGRVGGTSEWLESIGEGRRPLADWRELRDIAAAGIEIGGHSVSHAGLDRLPIGEASEEIGSCRAALEQGLGCAIETFAYPFGHENDAIRRMVRGAGYSSACAVRYAASSPRDDRFALARHIVRRGADIPRFDRILSDAVPFFPRAIDRARSRAYAAVRPVFRRLSA
jgi:peptidoglycan/xylan/chitin deacetylase (PgdA/CDA1 family)